MFLDFITTLRTWDPGHREPHPIPAWYSVAELAHTLDREQRLLVVKSRQMMVTWIGCAWVLYRAITGGPGVHLVISKEERSAKEMIERIRFLMDHADGGGDSFNFKATRSTITFPDQEARIVSLPASPFAVRGQSPASLFWDEMAFTPWDEEIWASVKPAIDSGGRFLGVSTPNGPLGVYYRLVSEGGDTFPVHRLRYQDHPARDRQWEARARAGLSPARWRREQELSFEGAEGRVYDQFDPAKHVLTREARPDRRKDVLLFRGIDFGYRRPAVVWAMEDEHGTLTVFADLLGDKWSLAELVEQIRATDARFGLSEADFTWTAVDPAGAANMDIGISPVELLGQHGFKIVHRPSTILTGIELVRGLLADASGRTRLRIDPRCKHLRTAFEGYAWDEHGEHPRKDGLHDHLMDALRYLVINLPRFKQRPTPAPPRIRGLKTN